MGAPLDPDKRNAITADIHAGQLSRNAIGKKHGVSAATVGNIAKAAGIDDAFDRTLTKRATRARTFDAKLARAQLIIDLYGDAQRFRERIWAEYTQIVQVPAGYEFCSTILPPLRDQQAGATAMAICLDKAVALEKVDDDGGAAAGKTMVNDLYVALKSVHAALVTEDGADTYEAPDEVLDVAKAEVAAAEAIAGDEAAQ